MKNLTNISASVDITDLENLGWDFTNIYIGVADALNITLLEAEIFEKERYHVNLKVDENGNLTYSMVQNAEYGNNIFFQGDSGDNIAAISDLNILIKNNKVWNIYHNNVHD